MAQKHKKADVFIRDLLQMINKFAALLLIGMASPYQILDWYDGRHTCHTSSGALAAEERSLFPLSSGLSVCLDFWEKETDSDNVLGLVGRGPRTILVSIICATTANNVSLSYLAFITYTERSLNNHTFYIV